MMEPALLLLALLPLAPASERVVDHGAMGVELCLIAAVALFLLFAVHLVPVFVNHRLVINLG